MRIVSRLVRLLLVCVLASPAVAQTTAPAPPTADDVAMAMRDTAAGWFRFRSDGSAASDSARRFAALALWDWEGGDRERGLRLLLAAWRMGVADSLFYVQAGLALITWRRPAQAVALIDEGRRRWPRFSALWSMRASALESLGRTAEAEEARDRARARRDS